MKTTKFFICSIFLGVFMPIVSAQQSAAVSGGQATGSGGTVSFSIGQVAYTSATGSGGTITQGVQQPLEIVTLGIDNFPEIVLSMSVYPNPTTASINLNVGSLNFENLQYNLIDFLGKEIQSSKIINAVTQIQMENLPKAIYLLNIWDKNKTLKTFKIIKN